jgi:glycerophosphoryl diester phosphodiesterase
MATGRSRPRRQPSLFRLEYCSSRMSGRPISSLVARFYLPIPLPTAPLPDGTLQQLFDFVNFYRAYYESGAGMGHPDAAKRAKNAAQVRINLETKINPRSDTDEFDRVYAERTVDPNTFAEKVASAIADNHLAERATVQSFDFRSLLYVQQFYPEIRIVCLFGDFPKFANPTIAGSDDGTNLQPEPGQSTSPWLAGFYWPYRETALTRPFRALMSGGFEGMALSSDRQKLYPLLEQPLRGDDPKTLRIFEFDLPNRKYTGRQWLYRLDPRGTNIGDFQMFDSVKGLIIERDGTQGDVTGFKTVQEIELAAPGTYVKKRLGVDLLKVIDTFRLSLPGLPGDVAIDRSTFGMPFVTIEDLVIFDRITIGVLNDNNYPNSVGRHVGAGKPDDNEFNIIKMDRSLTEPIP